VTSQQPGVGGEPGRISLAEFNALAPADARRLLAGCCAAPRWAAQVTVGRPFESVGALLAASDAAVAGLGQQDLEQALAGHPRIGGADGPEGPGSSAAGHWSRQEQAGVDRSDQDVLAALTEGNQAYERRFGHIYLVCATGRSGVELLALLRQRLGNDAATEWGVVKSELEKINRIRLAQALREEG
jgi:2-oxo-4-hydroxy-4-carboxy-5-ureidoimidazoline decarboxylase